MHRFRKHNVKREIAETSSSSKNSKEYDLAYYIHDRVELMHQVFSALTAKELKAMAPACVRHISIDDLQELCTVELLGISSKRLCAILDGAEPPSDTESSSASETPDKLETISLDSISSDEEILSQGSNKKNKKHKRCRHSKSKSKKTRKPHISGEEADKSKASRAGLTVLELLELQARARAIRAQLQQEQVAPDHAAISVDPRTTDDEVEIKEEPAEVVEISSEDEKPNVNKLDKTSRREKNCSGIVNEETGTITKRVKDLVITVPQSKQTRKIKLNRNKVIVTIPIAAIEKIDNCKTKTSTVIQKAIEKGVTEKAGMKAKEKQKKKDKKKDKRKKRDKDGSDHDEIRLQLSDSEKMDLLEDLDAKNLENVSSSSSAESDDSSGTSNDETMMPKRTDDKSPKNTSIDSSDKEVSVMTHSNVTNNTKRRDVNLETNKSNHNLFPLKESGKGNENPNVGKSNTGLCNKSSKKCTEVGTKNDTPTVVDVVELKDSLRASQKECGRDVPHKDSNTQNNKTQSSVIHNISEQDKNALSEGEISDNETPATNPSNRKLEVFCISDEESASKKKQKKKKNKKKEKKSKKDKDDKTVSNFRDVADQNFYTETNSVVKQSQEQNMPPVDVEEKKSKKDTEVMAVSNFRDVADQNFYTETETVVKQSQEQNMSPVDIETAFEQTNNDVNEILGVSDESCNDRVGTVLISNDPTTEEIEALTAKIDEIENSATTEEEFKEPEGESFENFENISWKDRYLDSKKVKSVLFTSNIFNVMRKKNKELKKKLEESKKQATQKPEVVPNKGVETKLVEGSIEHYNTLEGSTKYVQPVCEAKDANHENVTKEMKKNAKQLYKMYKKLLKFNDMNKQTDPNKKKKKKEKKNKKDKEITKTPTVEKSNSVN